MEVLQINEIPVSPGAAARSSPAELKMLPWLFIPAKYQSGVRFFLSGFLGREDKYVVTKYKIYLCARKWRVKIPKS